MMSRKNKSIITSANKYVTSISLILLYVNVLNGCEGYPTTPDIIPTSVETETKIALEIEITEIPPSFTESENEAENAARDFTINFDTETLNNTLSESDSDNNDDTTLTPTTLPPPPFSKSAIVEMEVIDTNTASEELDQTTTIPTVTNNTTTHLIDDDIIGEEEPHPDKKEILNELQNIWYYTEELGEDQTALKSSLSSLIHMTYARVYDQSDETLLRLKFLLRRLRSRLLDQRSKSHDDSESDPIVPTDATTVGDLEVANIPENGDTNNRTLDTHESKVPAPTNAREKRSIFEGNSPQQKSRRLDGDAIFGMVDSDENSLFQPIDKSDKVFPSLLVTEQSNDHERDDIPKIPLNLNSHSSISGEERIKMAKKVIGGENANNSEENGFNSNFVHLTIYQPDRKKNVSTIIQDYPTSTMSSTHSFFSSMSQFSPTTKIPHTNTKYQPLSNYNHLKQKYSIFKTSTSTTQIPKLNENVNNYIEDTNNSTSSMDDIIQSIIDVLGTPIHRPNNYSPLEIKNPFTSISQNLKKNSTGFGTETTQVENTPDFDTLPSYLQKLADGLGLGNTSSNAGDKNFTKVTTIPNNPANDLDESVDEELVDLLSLSTTNTMLNGTIEKVYGVITTFANLSHAARFVLFFSMTISIASIALGLYSLGPPIVAVGVLGIIVPILLLFLLKGNSGKLKSKQDLIHQLRVDEFTQALDMIADAMIKYGKN